ncbi:MAG: Jag N-terminal domain-containing protein [Pseudodesulfovibrio sp.]|nr:Jag N-terminal domain-containing protein [Pseudodesulfovibrio sp.]
MNDFKEFQGKDLDGAIESACDYFNLKRDRLEIEILGGGSSGIFGIMGVKKAKVKARPRASVSTTDILNGEAATDKPAVEPQKTAPKPKAPKAAPKKAAAPAPMPEEDDDSEDDVNGNVITPPQPVRKPREYKPRENKPREEKPHREHKPRPEARPSGEKQADDRPRSSMSDFDPVILEKTTHEVMAKLLQPIVGDTTIVITLDTDRVRIFIDDEENSGLIIGREGQTLSSLQYLVNRLVSRKMEASVRIQVDTGDYRERQDDKLRQVAWHLAEKADSMGRTQSTKPLSSYHRRVVHLALQDNETVFTRSKGDGPMKRVLIVPKSRKNGNRPPRD